MLEIPVCRSPEGEGLPLPTYATEHSAGMDLYAAVAQGVTLHPGERSLVSTGIHIALPPGFEAQIRPRSGLALRHGITLLNTPGTIDADYRGIIQVILINLGSEPFQIRRGDRIAQMIVAPVTRAAWRLSEALDESARGEGGFGHTGR